MRTLEFIVNKQRLTRKANCDFSHIVAGSVGYLRAKFYFSSDWNGCKKAASFWLNGKEHGCLLDENDSCNIPPEVLTDKVFEVSVTGALNGSMIPTSKIKVKQEVR